MKRALLTETGEQATPVEHVPQLFSPTAFGRALGVCTATVRRMEKRGQIKGLRINRRLVRYPASELQKLLQAAQ
jgi:predicted site-specific integrase-resolvase